MTIAMSIGRGMKMTGAVDNDNCFQLPNKLKEYVHFYMTYNTEKRSEEDLCRLRAKNKYFAKDQAAHKRCIVYYVYPQLDDRQFEQIVRKIAARMDSMMDIENKMSKLEIGDVIGYDDASPSADVSSSVNVNQSCDQTQHTSSSFNQKSLSSPQSRPGVSPVNQTCSKNQQASGGGFNRRPTFASQCAILPHKPKCSVSRLMTEQRPSADTIVPKTRLYQNDDSNYCSNINYFEDDGMVDDVLAAEPIFEAQDVTEVPKMDISMDIEFECEICHVVSPSEFYVRPYPSIVHTIQDELTSMMNNYDCNACPTTKFNVGMYCTKVIGGVYKRFKVFKTSVDKTGNDFLILTDIDSGARIWCGTRGLCPLPLQFRYYQQQAIGCRLFGLAPSLIDDQAPKWSESVVENFKQFCSLTVNTNLMNVYEKKTPDNYFTVSMYKNVEKQKVWAHEYLVSRNFELLTVTEDKPAKFYHF